MSKRWFTPRWLVALIAVTLAAAPTTLNLDGRKVTTWAFSGTVPGPEIRANAGDVIRARVINRLPDPLTILSAFSATRSSGAPAGPRPLTTT